MEPVAPQEAETNATISHVVVKFEDQIYESDVETVGDSVNYLNEEYAEVYRTKIMANPDIAAIVSKDESGNTYVEYFPSEKELLGNYTFIQPEEKSDNSTYPESRSKVINLMPEGNISAILGVAELYDDKNFKDTELISYLTTSWMTSIPKLTDLGFNDKASSIKVMNKMSPYTEYVIMYTDPTGEFRDIHYRKHLGHSLRPVLKCFHNSNYSGTAIYCIAPSTGRSDVHMDYNLKTIGWNDRISAISWVLVFDFTVFEGENPLIPAHGDC